MSYSLFLGLGLTIFDRPYAYNLLHGLNKEWIGSALFWLEEVGRNDHTDNVQLWNHAVNVLAFFAGQVTPEATGPDADEESVKQGTPIAGFAPGIRLGLNNPEYAEALFEGAVNEQENCDYDELVARIDYMKAFINDAWNKNQARSSN